MDLRAIIIDGITTQLAGELFQRAPVTDGIRTVCSASYLHSLESFTFGALFGESLALSSFMPPVGDETPGEQLMNSRELEGFVDQIKLPEIAALTVSPDWPAFTERIKLGILATTSLSAAELCFFQEFFIREAIAYLGDDSSLCDSRLAPDQYVYGGKHYLQDRSLQDLLPRTFIESMVQAIRSAGIGPAVCTQAVEEFVSRVLPTHINNYWTFQDAVAGKFKNITRLPHVTRGSILRASAQQQLNAVDPPSSSKHDVERTTHVILTGIVPRALLRVLMLARDDRGNYLSALRETRDLKEFRIIRRRISEVIDNVNARKYKDAEWILTELSQASARNRGGHESVELRASIPGVSVSARVVELTQRAVDPGKYWLRKLIRDSDYSSDYEYKQRVTRMFKELEFK